MLPPYLNSTIKENIRKKNAAMVTRYQYDEKAIRAKHEAIEAQLIQQEEENKNKVFAGNQTKEEYSIAQCIYTPLGYAFSSIWALLFFPVYWIPFTVFLFVNRYLVKKENSKKRSTCTSYAFESAERLKQLRIDTEENIKKEIETCKRNYQQADKRADDQTRKEVAAYEQEVKSYCQKILKNKAILDPMVKRSVHTFEKMIAIAPDGAHISFIEADLIYEVTNTEITYYYDSGYTNPLNSYDFNIERVRNLSKATECEGLAQAIAREVIVVMKKKYSNQVINISVSHNDAKVTLHFKTANGNFRAAQSIV